MDEQIYEDDYVRVDENGITIKSYYFPIKTSKVVPWKNLVSYTTIDLSRLEARIEYKKWGMGMDDIWWAWYSNRYSSERLPQIVLTTGSWVRKGFACQDPRAFFETVKVYFRNKSE